jgi:hypothetical protein
MDGERWRDRAAALAKAGRHPAPLRGTPRRRKRGSGEPRRGRAAHVADLRNEIRMLVEKTITV